mmetsp:Transcript_62731/g.178148  ORF Transcript_62731/g.178148 Transcript_62731/m.178148 type:complete len:215 (+) Transcript_62731:1967-2611(+)
MVARHSLCAASCCACHSTCDAAKPARSLASVLLHSSSALARARRRAPSSSDKFSACIWATSVSRLPRSASASSLRERRHARQPTRDLQSTELRDATARCRHRVDARVAVLEDSHRCRGNAMMQSSRRRPSKLPATAAGGRLPADQCPLRPRPSACSSWLTDPVGHCTLFGTQGAGVCTGDCAVFGVRTGESSPVKVPSRCCLRKDTGLCDPTLG